MSTKKRKNSDERLGSPVPLFEKNGKILISECDGTQNSSTDLEDDIYPPFLLISSTGPSAGLNSDTFGLYRKTEQMKEGRNVYKREHDPKYKSYDDGRYKLFSEKGVWVMSGDNDEDLKAVTPSKIPTSVKWQYKEYIEDDNYTWLEDPALTVTGLSEKPICECEVTISLSQNVGMNAEQQLMSVNGMAGVYRAEGSYYQGRPVLKHSEGLFTLLAAGYGKWNVKSGDPGEGGDLYLYSGSAPSQCPADPRAAIATESLMREEQLFWRYCKNYWDFNPSTESEGISLKCNKCVYNVDIANIKIQELERTIKTQNAEIEELRSLN